MKTIANENKAELQNKIKKDAYDLIYLLSCELNEEAPSVERCREMNLLNVYRLASMHMLASAAAYALEQVTELPHEFDQAKKKAIRKLSLFEIERSSIFAEFEKAGIWYLPLKGIVLGKYYPKTAMREMSDNDVLIDSQKCGEVKSIMERLGYKCESYQSYKDDIYTKPPTIEFEMHNTVFGEYEDPNIYKYYLDFKDRLICSQGFCYKMSNEDLYIYLIAHTYKHCEYAGIGIRPLADIYIFLKKTGDSLDFDYIQNEFCKIGLSEFERKVKNLSNKVFTNKALDKEEEKMLDYMIFSTAFGNSDNLYYNQYARNLNYDDSKKAKKKYIKNRFFITEGQIAETYPFFYKHKILYPVLFVYRMFRGLFCRRKEILKEYKDIKDFKIKDRY